MRSPDEIIDTLLDLRRILAKDRQAFLQPDFGRDLLDANLMKGMTKATQRICAAIEAQEKIAVFGDYDADGVPATALLVRVFRQLNYTIIPLIPTRASGYGLTMEVVKHLTSLQVNVLITVDNGTVARDEIAALAAVGIDVIVCDHHEPQEGHIATEALAILNPKQADCQYPFKELCGCAIAWKLAWALFESLGKNTASLKWELDLVGLSTVADMVPLRGENRMLAVYGLKVMAKTRNCGLAALADIAGLDLAAVSAGHIGFRLAPRINAPSRMHQELIGTEHAALSLLTTQDSTEACKLAAYLDEQNTLRQDLLEEHLVKAQELIQPFVQDSCLVLYDSGFSSGVIGLLAGRLLETYSRPVIVLAQEEGVIKGSVRSVDGVHAVEMLAGGELYLERYGGHSKAAGLTLKGKNIEEFRSAINDWLKSEQWDIKKMAEAAQRTPDMEISLQEADLSLTDALQTLEPFGVGFATPLFTTRCTITNMRWVGKASQHLSFRLLDNGTQRKGIAFSYTGKTLEENQEYEVHFNLQAEEWNNTKSASCMVKAILV